MAVDYDGGGCDLGRRRVAYSYRREGLDGSGDRDRVSDGYCGLGACEDLDALRCEWIAVILTVRGLDEEAVRDHGCDDASGLDGLADVRGDDGPG